MTYRDLLQKINNDIPAENKAAARAFLVSEKKKGSAAAGAWSDCFKMFGDDLIGKSDKRPVKASKTKNKAVKPEKQKDISLAFNDDISENKPLTGDVIGSVISDDNIDGLNMSEIENKIYIALDDFIQLNDIEDMKKAPFRFWRAASCYIGNHVFKQNKILKQSHNINNAYDLEKIKAALNFYVYLCDVYNKPITIDACEMFLGVHDGFLSENKNKLTSAGSDLWKKSEASIAAGIIDGKTSPVGALAHLNHYFNWDKSENKPVTASVNVAVYPVLSAAAVPVLPDNNNM